MHSSARCDRVQPGWWVGRKRDTHMDVHDDVWTAYCQEPGEEILPDSLDPLKGLAVDGPSTLSETSVGRCRLECLPDEPLCVRNRQAVNRVALHHGRQSGRPQRSAQRGKSREARRSIPPERRSAIRGIAIPILVLQLYGIRLSALIEHQFRSRLLLSMGTGHLTSIRTRVFKRIGRMCAERTPFIVTNPTSKLGSRTVAKSRVVGGTQPIDDERARGARPAAC